MNVAARVLAAFALCAVLAIAVLPLTLDLKGISGKSNDHNVTSSLTAARSAGQSAGQSATIAGQSGGESAAGQSAGQSAVASFGHLPLRAVALVRSLLAGLSTSLGAGVVLVPKSVPTNAQMAFALALAGGVMVSVSMLELSLPKLLAPGWRMPALAWSSLGAFAFFLLARLIPEPDYAGQEDCEDCVDIESPCNPSSESANPRSSRTGKQWRLAALMMLALTAHNFPEGLAVAVSSLESERLGFVVMAAIAVHNIPEGIAIAMPVFNATKSRMRALQMATLSGLAEPLGAIVALTMIPQGMLDGRGMDALLCVVGGIMTSVAFVELFPEARAQKQPLAAVAGALTGSIIMLITIEYA